MPLVDHVSEVLVVQLVCLVPSVEARGPEDGQEAGVVGALLDAWDRGRVSMALVSMALVSMWLVSRTLARL